MILGVEGRMKDNYYAQNLNSNMLFEVYDTKLNRIKQYLNAEIAFVKNCLIGDENVLELGTGYGRIVKELSGYCQSIVGIDISSESVDLGNVYVKDCPNAKLMNGDVHSMRFEEQYDVVLCLQNGLSAMKITTSDMIDKILDMVVDGGKVFFSTYSDKFWDHRLLWFEEQAEKGLLGEIDYSKTKNGVICCKDGFKSTSQSKEELESIGKLSKCSYEIHEVDESSVFLIIRK